MQKGTVKFFNTEKGYGFIHDEESKKDIFVHKTGLIDQVTDNDKVEYEIEDSERGPVAKGVKRVE